MHLVRLDPGEKWTFRFYLGLTLFVVAAIWLMLIPEGAIEALTGSAMVQH